jgi:glycosyltransferase involved in cell wall biosynthesis
MSAPVRVLELRSVRGTGGGPEKTILLGAANADPDRWRVTVCYIRDARDEVFGIDSRASGLGVDYVEIRERNSFDPSVLPALRRLVRSHRIDIVHAHDYKTDLLAWLLHRLDGTTVMSTAHGWTGHSSRERRFYYPLDKWLLARLPYVVAVSSQIQDELIARGTRTDRIEVILNGIDHRVFRRDRGREAAARAALGVQPGEVVIGAVGRLEPQKRFDLLIDAFARLRTPSTASGSTTPARGRADLRLLIAGDGSLRPALQRHIESAGLAGVARLVGHTDDVAAFHHALDLFVQSSDYEGTPNAVLEAMAFETPLVATSAGGTAELVQNGVHGLVLAPGDEASLAQAIATALTDEVARRRWATAARRRVETDLSFEARMRKLERVYDRLGHRLPDAALPRERAR